MRTSLSLLLLVATIFARAATINVVNQDSPGEGLNDSTPVSPVGGNTGTTVGQQRLLVMQRAAALWGARIISSVTIQVGAEFNALTCSESSAVLGSAGPRSFFRDFAGAPAAGTYYPVALANSFAGTDLDPANVDVEAEFNSNLGKPGCLSSIQWYYGLDGNAPAGTIDFLHVVLHEYAHGLGFLSTVDLSTGAKLNGFNDPFMVNLEDHSTGKLYPNMTDAERLAASTDPGDLHWIGANVVSASGFLATGRDLNGHVLMYAPNPVQPGSSVSHFDVSLSPNELMEPFANAVTDRRLTEELFRDIGWNVLPSIQTNGQALLSETCVNGAIDPGETVTVDLTLRNMGLADVANLTATLLSTNGVTLPGVPQNYGAMAVVGASVTRSFAFTAAGQCGDVIRPTLQLQDGAIDYGQVSFAFRLGKTREFTNSGSLSLPNSGAATPYPSTITISNYGGVLNGLEVRLVNITHSNPDDIDILLVGPTGQKALLMSDSGGTINLSSVTLTLSDSAGSALPDTGQITTGTYRPANYGTTADTFSAPAPGAPYGGTLSVFNGTDPNGTWQLFVMDDATPGSGNISGGWVLILPACCSLSTNQPPLLTVSPSPSGYVENAAPINIAAEAAVTDNDSPTLQGGALTIALATNGTTADQLGIRNDGSGPGAIGLSANTVLFEGVAIGTFAGGTNGSSLFINFNSTNATLAAVQALCRAITFFNISDAPSTNARSVRFMLTDGSGGETTATKTVTVTPLNDTPTISSLGNQSIAEDTSTPPLGFIVGDVDNPAASLLVSATSSNLTLVPLSNIVLGGAGSNRTVTIQPVTNQFGTTLITLFVTDGTTTNSTAFLLTVTPVNDAPTISSLGNASIPEDTSTPPLGFIVGDVETAAASLVVSATSSNLALVPLSNIVLGGTGSNRTVTIQPVTNQFGTTLITLFVTDGTTTNSTAFVLSVNPVNDAPAISPVPDQSVAEDETTTPIPFLIGDPETPANSLIVSVASSNLTLVPLSNIVLGGAGSNRTATITPAPNTLGTSLISLFVSDGDATNASSFLLTVVGRNDAPSISTVPDQFIVEDTLTAPIHFTVSDLETAASNLILSATSSNTLLLPLTNILLAGSDSNRTVTLQPATNQSGTTLITLVVSDGEATNSSSFLLTVSPLNDAPQISLVADQIVAEDTSTGPLPFTISDVDNQVAALVVTATSSNLALVPPANMEFNGTGSSRALTIVPATNAFGMTLITLFVSDGEQTNRTSFLLTVLPQNDAPSLSAVPDAISLEDTAVEIPFAIGDVETPAGTLLVSATSSNLLLLPSTNIVLSGSDANRTALLVPTTNQYGTTLITLAVSDGEATTTRSFLLTVAAVNDPPTISSISNVTILEDGSTGPIAFVVSDLEESAALLTVTAASSNAALVPEARIALGGSTSNRTVTIRPATNEFGTAIITLSVTDGQATNSATFVLNVTPVNDPPIISAFADQFSLEDTVVGPITFSVSDPEQTAAVLAVWATSSNETLIAPTNILLSGPGSNRSITLFPATNQFGSTLITVFVSDGEQTNSASFLLSIAGVNDAPVISPLPNQTIAEDTSTGPLLVTIGDVETASDDLVVTAASSNPGLISLTNIILSGLGSNRTVTITPEPNQNGTSSITLLVTDGQATNSTSFTLTVTNVSDAPFISSVADAIILEDHASPEIFFTIHDAETAAEALAVWASSSDTNLVPVTNILFGGSASNRLAIIQPATNGFGITMLTFFVTDGVATNSTSFLLTVMPVNDAPSINSITNVTVVANTGPFTIEFTGLTAGPSNELQTFSASASVGDPLLLAEPVVNHQPSATNGSLILTPLLNAAGTSVVSVVVTDSGGKGSGGIDAVTNMFTVVILPVADLAVLTHAAFAGTNLQTTVTLTNLGPHPAHDINVTNHTPDGTILLNVISDAGTCVSSNSFVICSFASLLPGASASLSLILAVEPRPLFTNASFIGSSDLDSNPTNNVAIAIVAMGGEQDFDADGLPDWWELANATDPRMPDGSADPDFDGLTNLEEYRAGTNPHDPASVLRITRIALANGIDSVVLSFLAVSNRTYSVLGAPGLGGPWTSVAGAIATQDGIMTVTNSGNVVPARFYRVMTP